MTIAGRVFWQLFAFRTRREKVDQDFYYRRYPDVGQSGMKAAVHYAHHGWREGRNPSAEFNSAYYAVCHLPGGLLCENPLLHFVAHGGEASGLSTLPESMSDWVTLQKQMVTPQFDEYYYRKHYGDQLGGFAPIDHYFAIGWRTGCNPCSYFDSQTYLDQHSHIINSDISPLFHYILTNVQPEANETQDLTHPRQQPSSRTQGFSVELERAPDRAEALDVMHPYFDFDYYNRAYQDVANANLNPLMHFADYGWREGRNPSPMFHTRYYQALYGNKIGPDVNPLYHYAVYGRASGYRTNPIGIDLWPRPEAPSDADWARAVCATDDDPDVNVIIPVYSGYDDTLATIHSVLTQPQKKRFRLTVINDFSPDPRLTSEAARIGGHVAIRLFGEREESRLHRHDQQGP